MIIERRTGSKVRSGQLASHNWLDEEGASAKDNSAPWITIDESFHRILAQSEMCTECIIWAGVTRQLPENARLNLHICSMSRSQDAMKKTMRNNTSARTSTCHVQESLVQHSFFSCFHSEDAQLADSISYVPTLVAAGNQRKLLFRPNLRPLLQQLMCRRFLPQ